MRLGFGPQDWDLGLETGIEGGTEEEKKKEEKIPYTIFAERNAAVFLK